MLAFIKYVGIIVTHFVNVIVAKQVANMQHIHYA